jgi:hypothetical protein
MHHRPDVPPPESAGDLATASSKVTPAWLAASVAGAAPRPHSAPKKVAPAAATQSAGGGGVVSVEEKAMARKQDFEKKNKERYQWLENPKDDQGRQPGLLPNFLQGASVSLLTLLLGEEGYDPSKLWIPSAAWQSFTAFEDQCVFAVSRSHTHQTCCRYWKIKKDCFDVVVFHKKGKFFELFERDADIGHNVLGLRSVLLLWTCVSLTSCVATIFV